jgi:hypothetical protein
MKTSRKVERRYDVGVQARQVFYKCGIYELNAKKAKNNRHHYSDSFGPEELHENELCDSKVHITQ